MSMQNVGRLKRKVQFFLYLKMPPRRKYKERRVRVHLHKTAHARAHVHVAHVGHKIRVAPKTQCHRKKIEPIRSSEAIVITY